MELRAKQKGCYSELKIHFENLVSLTLTNLGFSLMLYHNHKKKIPLTPASCTMVLNAKFAFKKRFQLFVVDINHDKYKISDLF